jgi:hypothetical protein
MMRCGMIADSAAGRVRDLGAERAVRDRTCYFSVSPVGPGPAPGVLNMTWTHVLQ